MIDIPLEDEPTAEPSEKKKEKAPKKKSKLLQRILTGVLTVLLVILAVLVFVFRDRLDDESLRESFGKQLEMPQTYGEAFAYESGTDQVFASVGDGLAVASGSAIQLLNADGETVWKQIISYSAPTVLAAEDRALFCDIGGHTATVVDFDGESAVLETNDEILTAAINRNGWVTLVTEATGYKSLVLVYNADRELQYEWWSGSGYVLRAIVSPDNRLLVALCVDGEGSKLHFFALSDEEELAVTEFPRELAFDLCFRDNSTLCCLSESALHFVRTDGTEKGLFDLGSEYLMDYDFGSADFVTVFVSAYRTGTGGRLMTVSNGGELLGETELSRNVTSLSAQGKQLLVMTGSDIGLYGQDLVQLNYQEALMTAKKAILQPSGDILLLSAYAAEQFQF